MLRAIVRSYRLAFSGLPREVWVLAACLFVNRLGLMVLPFLELYLMGELGYEVDAAGRVVALWGVGSIGGVAVGGRLADRFGPRRVQLASLALSAVCILLLWQARAPFAVMAGVLAVSCASEAFRPANGSAISEAAHPEQRARAFSLMALAANLGVSFGLPIGGLLARSSFDWVFLIDAATALSAAAVLLSFSKRGSVPTRESAREAASGPSPWSDRRFLLVIVLMTTTVVVLFQFVGALPVYLKQDLGLDEAGVGAMLAFNTAIVSVFGMLVVRWVERKPELRWLGIGSFLICAGYAVNALGATLGWALASILVWSIGDILFFPLGASFATRRAPKGAVGRYLGVYHLGFGAAFALAPLLGTQIYSSAGPRSLWLACGAVAVVVLGAFELMHRRDALELEPGSSPNGPRRPLGDEPGSGSSASRRPARSSRRAR
jgi:predicted MFS family arabinose efflux permease